MNRSTHGMRIPAPSCPVLFWHRRCRDQPNARSAGIRTVLVGGCLLLGICVGCGRDNPDDALARVNETNMQRLANLYLTYQMKNNWRGPADEAEFREFISRYDARKLNRIGVDPSAIDELFINPRDGKPFQIRYSVQGSAMGSSEPVVFESVGVAGKRMVGFLDMEQREVDEAAYNDLWTGTTQPAQPGNRPSG